MQTEQTEQTRTQLQPWERQPGETRQAYHAAKAYFQLGTTRTIKSVAQQLGKSYSTLRNHSAYYKWPERARAYDMYMERIQQREREKALVASAQEDAQRWAQRMREGCEVEWEVSQSLVSRVREMLATPLEDMRWSPRDVATYSDLASRLSRQAVHEMIDTVEADDGQTMTIRVEYCDLPRAAHSQ